MKSHHGQILRAAIDSSGFSVQHVADRSGIKRTYFYQLFERPVISLDYFIRVGKAINYDFTGEVNELRELVLRSKLYDLSSETLPVVNEHSSEYSKLTIPQQLELCKQELLISERKNMATMARLNKALEDIIRLRDRLE